MVANPTVSGIGHPPTVDDPQASLRVELLGKLVAAQFSIEAVIAELEQAGTAPDAIRNQLQSLTDMQRSVGTASLADLAMLRTAIASTVETAQGVVQQARATAASDSSARDLAETSARTRATISDIANDLFERRVLDPYLQFASAEDEAEYRRREAERRAYIEAELAKGTPEGTLNAATATREQLQDARNHGADRSPDFDRMLAATDDAERALRAALPDQAVRAAERTEAPAVPSEFEDIMAAFRDAGVTTTARTPVDPAHGLAQATATATVRGV